MRRNIFTLSAIIVASLATTLAVNYFIFAWTPPDSDPPGGTIPGIENVWSFNVLDPTEIYYSADNVGIGTTDPITPLHITGEIFVDKDDTLISFDDGQKIITSNDGGGNWNFRSGNYYGTGEHRYFNAGDGAVQMYMSSDATNGLWAAMVSDMGTAADEAITWENQLTLSTTLLTTNQGLRVAGLADCDTIDTDASGNLSCGTDGFNNICVCDPCWANDSYIITPSGTCPDEINQPSLPPDGPPNCSRTGCEYTCYPPGWILQVETQMDFCFP